MRATKTKKEEDHGRDQAIAQINSICEMVERLEHCRECKDPDCGIDLGKSSMTSGEYHDEDAALQAIQDDPLEISIRSDWYHPGEDAEPTEFNILLCTGGPACRILGDLDEHKQPSRAYIQHQDWFKPWTELILESWQYKALLTYCQQFYFGD